MASSKEEKYTLDETEDRQRGPQGFNTMCMPLQGFIEVNDTFDSSLGHSIQRMAVSKYLYFDEPT